MNLWSTAKRRALQLPPEVNLNQNCKASENSWKLNLDICVYIYKWHVFKITPNFFWPSSDRFDSFDILLICRSRRSWRRPLKWPAIAVKLGRRSWEVEPTGPLQFNEMWMEIWGNYSQVCIFGSYVFFLFVNNSLLGWVYSCRKTLWYSWVYRDMTCTVVWTLTHFPLSISLPLKKDIRRWQDSKHGQYGGYVVWLIFSCPPDTHMIQNG